jgi:hypothetical protein
MKLIFIPSTGDIFYYRCNKLNIILQHTVMGRHYSREANIRLYDSLKQASLRVV